MKCIFYLIWWENLASDVLRRILITHVLPLFRSKVAGQSARCVSRPQIYDVVTVTGFLDLQFLNKLQWTHHIYFEFMIGFKCRRLFSSIPDRFDCGFSSKNGFLKTKHATIFPTTEAYFYDQQLTCQCHKSVHPGSQHCTVRFKMTEHGQKPRMTKYQTELSHYARVQKERGRPRPNTSLTC